MGALPARRFRHVKQVAVEQFGEPQPHLSWKMYLMMTGRHVSDWFQTQDTITGYNHILVDESLKVVAATGSMDGIDATGILDVLDIVAQLGRCVGGQTSEWSHLPEPGQQVQLTDGIGGASEAVGFGGMAGLEAPCGGRLVRRRAHGWDDVAAVAGRGFVNSAAHAFEKRTKSTAVWRSRRRPRR